MKKDILEEIKIPEGIDFEIDKGLLTMKKDKLELRRKLPKIKIEKQGNKVVFDEKKAGKKEKKLIMTLISHIKNMILGLKQNYEYKLEICSVHFPMNASFDKAKNEIVVKNFLGERKPRTAKLPENVDVKISGNIISIYSHDKEAAGLAASVIERLGKIRGRDKRIFQDGIFLVEKPGRQI